MKLSLFFKRLFYALVIGVLCSMWYLQNNDTFKEAVAVRVEKVFQEKFDAVFSGTVAKINLFTLTVYFKDIEVVPYLEATSWHWKARSMSGSLSLFSYFMYRKFGLSFVVDGYSLFSAIKDGRCVVENHFKKIASQHNLVMPLFLESIVFKNSSLLLTSRDVSIGTAFSGYVFKTGQTMKLKIQLMSGFLRQDAHTLVVTEGAGSVQGVVQPSKRTIDANLHLEYKAQLPLVFDADNQVSVIFDYADGKGKLQLTDQKDYLKVSFSNIILSKRNIFFDLQASASALLAQKIVPSLAEATIAGLIDLTATGSLKDTITGSFIGNNLSYNEYTISKLKTSFMVHEFDKASGAMTIEVEKGNFKTQWQCSLKKKEYDIYFLNSSVLKRDQKDFWLLNPGAFYGHIAGNAASLESSCNLFLQHEKTESIIPVTGSFLTDFTQEHTFQGIFDVYRYHASYKLGKGVLEVVDTELKQVINAHISQSETDGALFNTHGSISYDCIRPFLLYAFSLTSIGTGLFTWQGTYTNKQFNVLFNAENTALRFSNFYNVFTGFKAIITASLWPFSCTIEDTELVLHKGTITIEKGDCSLDTFGALTSINIPIVLHNCLCNWKDAFLVELSGRCFLTKEAQSLLTVATDIVIENGYLQENPLSLVNQKDFLHTIMPGIGSKQADFEGVLTVRTKDPFYIKTPYIESRALVDIVCNYKDGKPDIRGILKFIGGALHFPYKSIPIMHAELKFIKDQPYDPLIELIAEGMIKKYMINLVVGNSLQDPHIVLSANPRLTEEQIVSLLFSGTAQESLNIVVPTLLMHNIEKFLFTKSYTHTADSSWLEPLKRIRIVPSFADQTGRGGLRAAIEIEVNDKLHGMIQKNFSLSEDTRVEVEYIISDDISVKGIKDERSDLGAELEMRFTF